MRKILSVIALACAATIVGCGGGGGSAGTSSGSGGSIVKNTDPLIKSASLVDSGGVITNAIGASGDTVLKVALTDPSGRPLANQLVEVTGDTEKVIFPEGSTGLTNASGEASIKVARTSLIASGAGSLTVTYSYKVGALEKYPDGSPAPTADTIIVTYVGYELSTANLELINFDIGSPVLEAYGTRQLSVQANVNGKAAKTPVQISFSATCGQISPLNASSDNSGRVTVSYSATDDKTKGQNTQGCSGKSVELTANTFGASSITKTITVKGAPPTSLGFDSVTPSRIYLTNSGGVTQAIAQFRLVNARDEPLLGQDVRFTLKTLNGGLPKAFIGTVGNTESTVSTTDENGNVSVPVFSGTVPTNVIVNASLVQNPLVQTDSAVLAIASGRPAQARVSLSIEKLAIEGWSVDGTDSKVTMSLADRQGNPVPDGTAVNFVTSGGVMIPPTCTTGEVPGDSRCTVTIRSQNPRIEAHKGRVQILAYSAGEEDFVDANFNNVYDCGESWSDLGTAFRDDDENGVFNTGEFSVPRAASISACGATKAPSPGNAIQMPGGTSQGDNVWGAADVRQQSTIIFATGGAAITGNALTSRLLVTIADLNGNSLPTGTEVLVEKIGSESPNGVSVCGATSKFDSKIANTLSASLFSIPLTGCKAGDTVEIKTISPLGLTTTRGFTVQ